MTEVQTARSMFDALDAAGAAVGAGRSFDRSVIDSLAAEGLIGVAVPKEAGGSDLPLTDAVSVWSEISRADGSIGWCAFAADSALAYFGAYLPQDGLDLLLGLGNDGALPILGGQFAPNGTAVEAEGGWLVDGEYQFGSGITLADAAGAGFFAQPADGGDAAYLMGSFDVSLIEPRGNWDVLGLRATQSIDYGVHGVTIPRECTFDFFDPTVHRGSAKHHLGVIPLTAAGHAAWAMGVTQRMLEELVEVARTRSRMGATSSMAESDYFLINLARLESRRRSAAAWVMEACEEAEAECAASGDFVTIPTANLLRQACVHANREGAGIAREAYALAGTPALREGPLQRCFRDLNAGAQHYFASDAPSIEWGGTLLAAK